MTTRAYQYSFRRKEESNVWDPFHIDVERILYSKAYSRYADKTQVVYLLPHDHIANRGLHVQLVSALSRTIGRELSFSLDLLEAISLAHDIGHPPFGHDGERYLSALSQEVGLGAFSHARQSCRVVSEIEPMNLTFATLDGLLCHDGGMKRSMLSVAAEKSWKEYERDLFVRLENTEADLSPATNEAALVKLIDTVSYLERDISDALLLGLVQEEENPLQQLKEKTLREFIAHDLIHTYHTTQMIGVSSEAFELLHELKRFSTEHIYFHNQLKGETKKIYNSYRLLFYHLLDDFNSDERESIVWKYFLHNKNKEYQEKYTPPQYVVDYIAGTTDGYFLRLFQELFLPRSIEVPNVLPFS